MRSKSSSPRMRIFLAVFPPPAAQEAAAAVIDRLRRPGDGVSWVQRDNLHFTLRFIGEVGADGARRVGEAARAAAARCAPFEATLGPPGAFPNPHRARVLWLGLSAGGDRLVSLARALEEALEPRGFEREGKAFSSHLTIGRVRDPRADWTAPLAEAPTLDPGGARFRVERLCVVESRLDPKGSIYTVRESADLSG